MDFLSWIPFPKRIFKHFEFKNAETTVGPNESHVNLVRIESTHTHLMNKEHKNFIENEMRDLEREREKPIFRGNTP